MKIVVYLRHVTCVLACVGARVVGSVDRSEIAYVHTCRSPRPKTPRCPRQSLFRSSSSSIRHHLSAITYLVPYDL